MSGRILRLDTRGFGFVMGDDDGIERFFAAKEVRNYPFDSLVVGERVTFDSKKHPFKGLRAINVRRIAQADEQQDVAA